MRKVILGLAISLDGYIEGPNGEYDWCFGDQDYGMRDFMKRIDTIFYGRKSFQMAGGNIVPTKKAYVFSRTLEKIEGAELIKDNAAQVVRQLVSQPGKDIWLFGGADLTTSLLKDGCVNELWMSVHPILLGSGKLLFQQLPNRIKTKLIESKAYETGLVSLKYEVLSQVTR